MAPDRIIQRLRTRLRETLRDQTPDGQHQFGVEGVCLAVLALRTEAGPEFECVVRILLSLQTRAGGWPAFAGDDIPECWTTALAALTLTAIGQWSSSRNAALNRLADMTGREANWFWQWKFRAVDNSVSFDPRKYGWSWVPGTTSWVIPTAIAILALRQAKQIGLARGPIVDHRIKLGIEMLFDRMCPGGGWNAGNGIGFGVAYAPYIDATGIALLALRGWEDDHRIQQSLRWLAGVLPTCPSPYSLAWGILGLAAYRNRNSAIHNAIAAAAGVLAVAIDTMPEPDTATLATCALALAAVDGASAFEVSA